jgi:hypothetical protein
MRRTSILALRYSTTLLPAGALAACFGGSTTSGPADAGLGDVYAPTFDAGHAGDAATPATDSAHDAASDAATESAADAGGADSADAAVQDEFVVPPPSDAGDAAPEPAASFPTATIDFGLVDCGSPPASAKTYSFQNVGNAPLIYSASLGSGSVFTIQAGATGTLQAGATATITLTAQAVPATSTAGTPLTAVLTLTTNVPGSASVTVPVQLTPQGGSLTVAPAVAGFGQVQLASAATPVPLTITNVGNAPIQLALGTPTDPEFSVTYKGAPAAVTLAASAAVPGAQAQFTPTLLGMRTATVPLQTTGVMCASPATAISLSGEGTTAPVTVAPSPVDFGTVACGSSTAAKTVTITNGYSYAITYTATLAAGASSPFAVNAPSGTVPASGQTTITITPKAIPVPGSVASNAYGDTLTVATSAPATSPATIPLLESASGAVLSIQMATTAFGPVAANSTASLPFAVVNGGNANATVSVGVTGAGFGGAFTGSTVAAAGGGSAPGMATYSPPGTSTNPASGSLAVSASGAVCGPASPVGLTAQPEVPVAMFSSAMVSLASTCPSGGTGVNSTGTASVSITNSGNAPLTISGVTSSTAFVVAQGPTASIAPGMTGTIALTTNVPANTPAGARMGTLSFKTNEFGSPTHTIPLAVTVSGANLSFTVAAASGTITYNGTCYVDSVTYGIANSGNQPATLSGPTQTSGDQRTYRFLGQNPALLGTPYNQYNQQLGTFMVTGGVAIAAGASATDVIADYDEDFNAAGSSVCSGTDVFAFTAAGNICVGLPALNYVWAYTSPGHVGDCICS